VGIAPTRHSRTAVLRYCGTGYTNGQRIADCGGWQDVLGEACGVRFDARQRSRQSLVMSAKSSQSIISYSGSTIPNSQRGLKGSLLRRENKPLLKIPL
jgi:hypothetical protein